MSTTSELSPESTVPILATQPLYWSIRRELWENRSIYLAPLGVAMVVLFGFVISTIGMPHRRRALMLLGPEQQRAAIMKPYDFAAIILIMTAFLVGIFYCLDALYGERRDRSILFWKSLPVSDRTAVLSKACIPLVILPLITFVLIVTTQFVMLIWTSMVLLPSGLSATTFMHFNLFRESLILLYGLIAVKLWNAPIYAWLLLVSAWSRRAPLLWAVLPPLVIGALEKIAFNSTHFASMLKYRFTDFASTAFAFDAKNKFPTVTQLTPGRFLCTPGVWSGLLFAAIFITVAIRLRHDREPI